MFRDGPGSSNRMPARTAGSISLSPELEALIERQLASGRYRDADHVLRAALELLGGTEPEQLPRAGAAAPAPVQAGVASSAEAGCGFLAGGGEMGALIRAHDWAATPLGPPEAWTQSLKTTVRLALTTRHPVAIFWGPALTFLYNDAYAAAIGPERHPRALGQPGREVWDETWHIIGPQIDLVMSGRGATWHEDHLVPITRHGRREDVWWTYSYSPIDDDGHVGGVLVLCNDVTTEHRTREALRESEARLRAVFESEKLGLCIFDCTTGRTVELNQRALQLMDCTREEFETGRRDCRSATPPEYWPRDERALHRIRETGRADAYEKEYQRKHGSRVPVRLSAAPLPGQPGFVMITIEDLTERRAAEAAWREAEARSRSLLDAAPFSVIIIDPATHEILDVNDHACQEYGYSREEFLRLSIADIDALGDSKAIRARGRAHMVRPGTQEFEAQHRTKKGEIRDVLVRAQGVRIGDRDVTFGAHFDITERKATEARQTLLMRELDHRARNALAVVLAALRLTPKDDPEYYARAVEGRVTALARAHTLLAEGRWDGAELRALLEGELSPFLTGQRVELDGPRVLLPAAAAQSLAMAVHELATNAVKHGALSVPEGRIVIAWQLGQEATRLLHLRWQEASGPVLEGPPRRRGFGSRVLEATVRGQLGGQLSLGWRPEGLLCHILIPLGTRLPPASGAPDIDMDGRD